METMPMIDVAATAKRIDALMKEKGYTPKELQKIFRFTSPQAIYNWLWGDSLPSLDSLVVLAKLFDVKLDDIIVY